MEFHVHKSKRFLKSLKKIQQLKSFRSERLRLVISLLSNGEKLDAKYRDHKLSGDMEDYKECHLAPDILLIYRYKNDLLVLVLVNIGSHSNLFS